MTEEPTRERVEAYRAALRCQYGADVTAPTAPHLCETHKRNLTDLGCPVALAAARVEAERVAEVEDCGGGGLCDCASKPTPELVRMTRAVDRARELAAQRDALRAVVEQVRALHMPDSAGWCHQCSVSPCRTAALLPEPTTTREGDR